MKFLVRRASIIGDDKPCEEAFEETYFDLGFEREGWFVEINNLEELLGFQNKYGDIIIDSFHTPSITIYDDWIE